MTTPKLGTSFIEPHRDDPNARWRDYARLLLPLSTTANVEKTIVDGAATTFNALQNWIVEGASALRLWCALSRDSYLRAPLRDMRFIPIERKSDLFTRQAGRYLGLLNPRQSHRQATRVSALPVSERKRVLVFGRRSKQDRGVVMRL